MSSSGIMKESGISSTTAVKPDKAENINLAPSEDKEDDFSYVEIYKILLAKISRGELPLHEFNNYTANINSGDPGTKDFIYFVNKKPVVQDSNKFSPVGTLFKIYGLKFHISLPEDNQEMRIKGWGIIKNILINNHVNTFKVIQHGKYLSEVEGQQGKDVTIYANFNPEFRTRDWERILQEITQGLVDAGVKPGYRPPGSSVEPEMPVQGSNYITYRYKDEFREQTKSENTILLRSLAKIAQCDTGATRGWPHFDAVTKMKISTNNQQDIPVFISKKLEQTLRQENNIDYSKKLR